MQVVLNQESLDEVGVGVYVDEYNLERAVGHAGVPPEVADIWQLYISGTRSNAGRHGKTFDLRAARNQKVVDKLPPVLDKSGIVTAIFCSPKTFFDMPPDGSGQPGLRIHDPSQALSLNIGHQVRHLYQIAASEQSPDEQLAENRKAARRRLRHPLRALAPVALTAAAVDLSGLVNTLPVGDLGDLLISMAAVLYARHYDHKWFLNSQHEQDARTYLRNCLNMGREHYAMNPWYGVTSVYKVPKSHA